MSKFFQKVSRAPVRSPSPDIASRNIITRTPSPLNQILTKSRKNPSSRSPLSNVFNDNQEYSAIIEDLQQKNLLLSKQNRFLLSENDKKAKELDLLKDMAHKSRKDSYNRSESQLHYQPDILNEYESRIAEMSKEFKRVQEILINQRKKTDALERENRGLRDRESRNTQPLVHQQLKLKKQLADIEYSLNESFNNLTASYQMKVELVLKEEISKVNKVERDQKYLITLLQNHKRNQSPNSNQLYPNNQSNLRSPLFDNALNNTPTQRRNYFSTASEESQCQNCRILLRRISDLQSQLKIKQFTTNNSSKSPSPLCNPPPPLLEEYLRKLYEIKVTLQNEELQSSITHIEANLTDIYKIDQKFQSLISQKNRTIQELREKEVEQAIEMASLKKSNGILKAQVNEQLDQIDKLKELIHTQLKQFQFKEKSTLNQRRQPSIGQADILRKYIDQAVSRIQNLEDQIGSTLKE